MDDTCYAKHLTCQNAAQSSEAFESLRDWDGLPWLSWAQPDNARIQPVRMQTECTARMQLAAFQRLRSWNGLAWAELHWAGLDGAGLR